MTAPVCKVVPREVPRGSGDGSAVVRGGQPGPELIMKMIFSKVGPAGCVSVSMAKVRRIACGNVLIGGRRRAAAWCARRGRAPRQLAYAMLTSGGLG